MMKEFNEMDYYDGNKDHLRVVSLDGGIQTVLRQHVSTQETRKALTGQRQLYRLAMRHLENGAALKLLKAAKLVSDGPLEPQRRPIDELVWKKLEDFITDNHLEIDRQTLLRMLIRLEAENASLLVSSADK